jgi:hypothetical protein
MQFSWREVASKIGGVIGAIIVVVVVGGIVFARCVAPFVFNGEDDISLTCNDPEISDQCDDHGTLENFFVEVCGREAVEFRGDLIRTLYLGGGVAREPGEVVGELWCADRRYTRWEIPEDVIRRGGLEFDDYRRYSDSTTKLVLDTYEEWASFRMTTDEARMQLLTLK